MKVFANKSIWKKLVFILLFITIFSFAVPQTVHASDDDTSLGGKLMKPIINLIVGLGDGVVNILHKFLLQQQTTLIRIDLTSGFWRKILCMCYYRNSSCVFSHFNTWNWTNSSSSNGGCCSSCCGNMHGCWRKCSSRSRSDSVGWNWRSSKHSCV